MLYMKFKHYLKKTQLDSAFCRLKVSLSNVSVIPLSYIRWYVRYVSVFQRENIACWTLEQINDQIYLDNDLNMDNSIDRTEMDALLVNWGIVGKAFQLHLSMVIVLHYK